MQVGFFELSSEGTFRGSLSSEKVFGSPRMYRSNTVHLRRYSPGCLGDVRNTTCQQGTKNPTNRKYRNGGMAMAGANGIQSDPYHPFIVWYIYLRLLTYMVNVGKYTIHGPWTV